MGCNNSTDISVQRSSLFLNVLVEFNQNRKKKRWKNSDHFFGQTETISTSITKQDMNSKFHVQTTRLPESGNLQSVAGDDTLTLLKAYNAELIDVRIDSLIFSLDGDPISEPVRVGELILMKAVLTENHQIRPITIRKFHDNYQVLDGERLIQAMIELGHEMVTAVIIDCSDEVVDKVRNALLSTRIDIPYSVRIGHFNELKETVKAERKKAKKSSDSVPTTDELLSEVLGQSKTAVKQIANIAKSDRAEDIAKDLDSGTTLNSLISPKKTSSGYTPKKCSISAEYDVSLLCPECPKHTSFMDELRNRQSLINSKN